MTTQAERDTKTLLVAHKSGAVMFGEPNWEMVATMEINPELVSKWKAYITAKKELESTIASVAAELGVNMEGF